jgi:hypothetical protein
MKPALLVIFALSTASAAGAVTVGNVIQCDLSASVSGPCGPATAVVGAGTEFSGIGSPGFFSADFSEGELLLSSRRRGGSPSHFIIKFTNLTTPFTTVRDLGSNMASNYSFQNDVSLSGGVLSIDLGGLPLSLRSTIRIGFGDTAGPPAPPPAAVPEPASWAMLIAGFAMVGASLRRRSRRLV